MRKTIDQLMFLWPTEVQVIHRICVWWTLNYLIVFHENYSNNILQNSKSSDKNSVFPWSKSNNLYLSFSYDKSNILKLPKNVLNLDISDFYWRLKSYNKLFSTIFNKISFLGGSSCHLLFFHLRPSAWLGQSSGLGPQAQRTNLALWDAWEEKLFNSYNRSNDSTVCWNQCCHIYL